MAGTGIGQRSGGAGGDRGGPAAHATLGRSGTAGDPAPCVPAGWAALPALRGDDRRAGAGRRQPDDILVPGMPTVNRLRRVGHKGADLIAPGNTHASFDAALEAGVDMIEFDVLPERGTGRLVLAHDYEDAARRTPHTLEEGLAHLASTRFAGIDLDVDLKLPGYELEVVSALRAHGVLERSLISSQY